MKYYQQVSYILKPDIKCAFYSFIIADRDTRKISFTWTFQIELDVFPFADLVCHWPKFYFLYIPTIKTIKRYFIMMVFGGLKFKKKGICEIPGIFRYLKMNKLFCLFLLMVNTDCEFE